MAVTSSWSTWIVEDMFLEGLDFLFSWNESEHFLFAIDTSDGLF
jgi:hypothetical protein